jgi:hypothetical protein
MAMRDNLPELESAAAHFVFKQAAEKVERKRRM